MANAVLTPTAVTREVLRVAHEKLRFIGTVERQYDDSFAKTGAKTGDTLKIRLPNQYTVRTGKALNAQDTEETSVSLTVATQKGVDMNFSSAELTMELDDFSKRIIEPAVAVLVSNIESTMLTAVTKEVYNSVGAGGTAPVFLTVAKANAKLSQGLAPDDDKRFLQMESVDMAASVGELKGLFHDSSEIAKQYREGKVGVAAGFTWYSNERVYRHANDADVTGLAVNNGTLAEGMSSVTIDGASTAPTVGSVFTMAATYAVHPETKVAYTHLQQFTVTAATTTLISFSPAIYAAGAKQNVSILPVNDDALVFVSVATTAYPQHLAYHKEAFAFASADLEMPEGVAFAGRENLDGLSIRVVRQYDINNDNIPCRLDILHGYKAIRPEWACRLPGLGS